MSRRRVRNDRRRQEERREGAQRRQEARDSRTPQEQLQRLDELLGVGQGAQRERARLQALIKEKLSDSLV